MGKRRLFLAPFLAALLAAQGLAASPSLDDELTGQAAQQQQFFDGASARPSLAAGAPAEASSAQKAGSVAGGLAPQGESAAPSFQAPIPGPRASGGERKRQSWERLEDRLFTISWWMYHAAWASDAFMTGWGISHGMGFEADHLYTLFGKRNVAGVVGSLAAGHLLVSGLTLMMHRKAKKRHGWSRTLLETAAIGINLAGVVAHACGVASWIPLL